MEDEVKEFTRHVNIGTERAMIWMLDKMNEPKQAGAVTSDTWRRDQFCAHGGKLGGERILLRRVFVCKPQRELFNCSDSFSSHRATKRCETLTRTATRHDPP